MNNEAADSQTNSGIKQEITVTDNPEAGQFEAHIGDDVAVAEYTRMENTIMFTHTEVPERLEGRGIGSQLIHEALESVKQRGLMVVPMCSFVAGYIREHPEYLDLVHPTHRAALHL
jgi:predicted GNAT family acetyltransferase